MKRHPQLIQLIHCYSATQSIFCQKLYSIAEKWLETLPNNKKEEGNQSFC